MKKTILKNQSGFSLVELMVVVAIIGILAALSSGQLQKQIAKSRQSEAKSQLSGLFTAEKAFFAEYNTYHDNFALIKYSPEGLLRYDVGFTAAKEPITQNALYAVGYTATPPTLTGTTAQTYCGNANKGTISTTVGCGTAIQSIAIAGNYQVMTTSNALVTSTADTALQGQGFLAGASANLLGPATQVDFWAINDNKSMTQVSDGIQ